MKTNILYLFFTLLFVSCSGSSDENNPSTQPPNNNNDNNTPFWSISVADVKDGGPGKDGIPSIDNPKFINANEAAFLTDNLLVIGVVKNGITRAYPHKILDWHEIVNDDFDGESVSINYCPLTGTAFGWEGKIDGKNTTFGVSGLLYNANLILYDRNTDSNWSQLKLECVNGNLIGDKPVLFSVIETTWGTWKTLYPNTKVLSTDTGINRNYEQKAYQGYSDNNDYFIFPPEFINNAIPNKERVHAIIEADESKVYQFSRFNSGKAIKDVFNGNNYLVVGNENIIYSYKLEGDYIDLDFEYDFNSVQGIFFKDNEGNKWSIFGEAIEGPRIGEKLLPSKAVMSYWFAIAVFYSMPEIYIE